MTWEYLAGFFDGEGTTGVYFANHRTSFQPRVGLVQSEERGRVLLEEAREFFAAHGAPVTKLYERKSIKHKPVWMLQTNNRTSVQIILTHLMPYLRIKKNEAQAVLDFLAKDI